MGEKEEVEIGETEEEKEEEAMKWGWETVIFLVGLKKKVWIMEEMRWEVTLILEKGGRILQLPPMAMAMAIAIANFLEKMEGNGV